MDAIGGYNQLSISNTNSHIHTRALKYQSARAALYAYLQAANVQTLYVPNYICDSIFPGLKALNIKIYFYSINQFLLPKKHLTVNGDKSAKILLVNYFGLLDKALKYELGDNPQAYIIDNSQALFCEHIEGTTSIYSPRKFFGMPDGGLLQTPLNISPPQKLYNASANLKHLLLRATGHTQEGYKEYLKAEKALECFEPKAMSSISQLLMTCSDISSIKYKRQQNYLRLASHFNIINQLNLPLNEQVPLCYPLKLSKNVSSICSALIKIGIYLPRYWKSEYSEKQGQSMYNNTLFLPIDERLNEQNMARLIESVSLVMDKQDP